MMKINNLREELNVGRCVYTSNELMRIKILMKTCIGIIEHGRDEAIKKEAIDMLKFYIS